MLKLNGDILLSTSAFRFNLHRYTSARGSRISSAGWRPSPRRLPASSTCDTDCFHETRELAEQEGHLELLQWAVEHAAP